MKYTLKKTLTIALTLDSSEMIMFTKGGAFSTEFQKEFNGDDDTVDFPSFGEYDKVEISVQLDPSQKGRYDWLTAGAAAITTDTCAERLGSTTPQPESFAEPPNPKFAYEDAKKRMNEYAKAAKKPKKHK